LRYSHHLVTFTSVLTFNFRIMANVFNRIVELIGWVVFGVSALLLVIAHHIDNYQSPPPANVVQTASLPH
jgi:hypothetical protein